VLKPACSTCSTSSTKSSRTLPKHVHAEPRAGDIYRSIGTPKKIMDMLGYKPQVTLAEGLKEAVEVMRNLRNE
jgi:nucleoside-diphosphate-sugar epimerase